MDIKGNRYNSTFRKISKRYRLLYNCFNCEESDYELKEVHHLNENKRDDTPSNIVVLCKKCHVLIHKKEIEISPEKSIQETFKKTKVRAVYNNSDWFDKSQPIKIIDNLPAKIANDFRKKNIKAFVNIGGCNFYIGIEHCGYLIGVIGFSNPDYGNYDIFLKADTTPSAYEFSTDLLLFILRTKEVQKALEKKFNRTIETAYSMCFSQHNAINRYRKHGECIVKKEIKGGFNLGYLFNLGNVASLKAAKAEWMQKHKI